MCYNVHISNDWLGHLRPGNGMPAVSVSALLHTIPGQWLQSSQGLINSSPVFLFALAGFVLLTLSADRRLLLVAILFGCTAIVNGTLGHWATVFTLPARFLITPMPALWIGLAVGIDRARRSAAGLLLLFGALTICWDTVFVTAALPEHAFQGSSLNWRVIDMFHPWDAWFSDRTRVPATLVVFWGLALAALVALLHGNLVGWRRAACVVSAALLPAVAFLQGGVTDHIARVAPTGVDDVRDAELVPANPARHSLSRPYRSSVGKQEGGTAWATTGTPGFLLSYQLPLLQSGDGRVTIRTLEVAASDGGTVGAVLISQRRVFAATAPWETRYAWTLPASGVTSPFHGTFAHGHAIAGVAAIEYTGAGSIAADRHVELSVRPWESGTLRSIRQVPLTDGRSKAVRLPPGRYEAQFHVSGTDWGSWFRRSPAPLQLAVSTDIWSATAWSQTDRLTTGTIADPRFERPMAEKIEAPWWTTIPLSDAYRLTFVLDSTHEVTFLAAYQGDAGLSCSTVGLARWSEPSR